MESMLPFPSPGHPVRDFCIQQSVKPLMEPRHLVRRLHRMQVNESVSEAASEDRAQYRRGNGRGNDPEDVHLRGRKLYPPPGKSRHVLPDPGSRPFHQFSIASGTGGILCLVIRVRDRHDHRQMAYLPGVHILSDPHGDPSRSQRSSQGPFLPVLPSERRLLYQPRSQIRLQYVPVEAAPRTGKSGKDPTLPAHGFPLITGIG